MTDYYSLLKKIYKNESLSDNDLELFKERKKYKQRDIQPSDYMYHDYYYKYMKMPRKITLHDDFINYAELGQDYGSPWRRKQGVRVVGLQYRYGPEIDQPIFNESLLRDLQHKPASVIYSKKNR